ncbi:MAG: chemotaxis protein CheC [Dehalococcoidales bacterium]|nr:chemotaxis protein CheC [Dehalococcoidales bacterium]
MQNMMQMTTDNAFDTPNDRRSPPDIDCSPVLPEKVLTKENMSVWTWLVSKGISNALSGLSQMIDKDIQVTSIDLKWLPAQKVIDLLGGPEVTVVGIYLTIEGDATGHILMLHDTTIAFQLIDMQLGLPNGSTTELDEMAYSVLGEMGNITGSFFLNALADSTSLVLMPSPPSVLIDMVGAVMNVPLTFIMEENDNVLIVKANFSANDKDLDGTFMVMPTINFMNTLLCNPVNVPF